VVNEPQVLLLDEPLGALDLKLREAMQEELKSLQRSLGITFVFVTHDQGEALSLADQVAVFNEGRIVQIGSPEDIYQRPRTRFVADFVGSANVLSPELCVAAGAAGGWASLRAEVVELAAPGKGRLDGNVASVRYMGPVNRVSVTVGGTSIIADMPASHMPPDAGAAVSLTWADDALHRMDEG